jgi:hypothetical protein
VNWRYLAATVAVALAACSGSSSEARPKLRVVGGMQVVADEVHGPGSLLGNGFVVPRGAYAIGPRLPDNPAVAIFEVEKVRARFADAWTAWLVVAGRPEAVFNDLLRQAAAHGVTFRGKPECRYFHTTGSAAGEVSCTASTYPGPNPDLFEASPLPKRVLSISLLQLADGCTTACESTVTVTYREASTRVAPAKATTVPAKDDAAIGTHVRRLPDVGQDTKLWANTRFPVQPDSFMLAPVRSNSRCYLSGRALLIGTDDDGTKVVDAYRRRLRTTEPRHPVATLRERRGDWDVALNGYGDGNTTVLESYRRHDDPHARQYLRIRWCDDT